MGDLNGGASFFAEGASCRSAEGVRMRLRLKVVGFRANTQGCCSPTPVNRPVSIFPWARLLFLAALLAGSVGVRAQGRLPLTVLPPLSGLPMQQTLQRWDKRSGLPQNTVHALAQTPDGYVWVGTSEGIVRFDGRTFTPFTPANTPTLPSAQINALRVGTGGRLWVGTARGVVAIDGGRFSPALVLPSLPEPEVYDLVEGARGRLWIGTLSGLVGYGGGQATRLYGAADGLEDTRVLALALDASGVLYLGTPSGLYRARGARFETVGEGTTGLVRTLFAAPNGTLYVGAETGLMQVNGGRLAPSPLPGRAACAPVRSIATDAQGALWVGTRSRGACSVVGGTLVPVRPEHGMPSGDLRALLADTEGGFWLGAEGGLVRLRRGRFATYGAPEELGVSGASVTYQDHQGALWVGTMGDGLVRFGDGMRRTFGPADGLAGQTVTALAEHAGSLWAATLNDDGGGRLCRFDGAASRFRCPAHPGNPELDVVYALLSTNTGFWAGTRQGVARWNGQHLDALPDSVGGLLGLMVNALVRTSDGSVWAGSIQGGLVRYPAGDPARARTYDRRSGLVGLDVVVLHVDDQGALWAGLSSGNVCRYTEATDRFRCYGTREGLSGSQVMQLLSDQRGALWIGTNSGYERVPLAAFDRLDQGRATRLPVETMATDEASGLRDPEAVGAVQPSALRLRDGRLTFATVGGLGVFDAGDALRFANRTPPPVHIERVRTRRLDAPPPHNGVLELPLGDRTVNIGVSVVAFSSPEKVQLRYRMEGYSDEWQTVETGSRTLSFNALRPGTYHLQVQAANAEGVWNTQGASMTFSVPPRFYETTAFRALLALVALLLLVQGVRWRLRSLVARQQELEQMVSERTAELQTSQASLLAREHELEQVNEGLEAEVRRQVESRLVEQQRYEQELIGARDEALASARLKETILNNMSHELRTPITAILGFSEVLALEVPDEMQEFVQYIDENGRRLLTTLNTVLDFSTIEGEGVVLHPTAFDGVPVAERIARLFAPALNRSGVALRLDMPEHLDLSTDYFGFERVLTHLLSNAVKFTERGHVRLALDPLYRGTPASGHSRSGHSRTGHSCRACGSRWRTPASASEPSFCPTSTSRSSRSRRASPGSTRAPAWG